MRRTLRAFAAAALSVALAAAVVWAAAYPVSVKTFTTKATGEIIQATHINDLQDEVVAIEQALLTMGFEHALKPKATATYDLGTTTSRWRDLFLGRTLDIDQGAIASDTKMMNLAATWNAGGVAFTGVKMNITDTASAASSKLLDLQVGGASKFQVRKDAIVTVGDPTSTGGLEVYGLGVGVGADRQIAAIRAALGTVTTDVKILDASATWNGALITFTLIKADVTDTASAADSLLMNLLVGGVSKTKIDKTGKMTLAGPLVLPADPTEALQAAPKQYVDALGSGADTPFRIIRGRIDTTTPTILQGAGFTVSKNQVGLVTITFSTAFGTIPAVVAMADRSVGTGGRVTFVQTVSTTQVQLGRVTIGDTYEDGTLHFIAIGPR